MVKLLKWFDTPDKIILLLEYAGGGRLEEFVKNYQSKRLSLSTSTEEHSPDDDKSTTKTITFFAKFGSDNLFKF